MPETQERCCYMVFRDLHEHRCCRSGTVKRNGNWYCFQHDPDAVEARDKKRDVIDRAYWDARHKARAKADRLQSAKDECYKLAKELVNNITYQLACETLRIDMLESIVAKMRSAIARADAE